MAANVDVSFPHAWKVEILSARPLILPARHFVYPRDAEEVERGALEVLIQPEFGRAEVQSQVSEARPGAPASFDPQPFLATCALGFRDPMAPSGVWSTPDPSGMCAVAGGYAYIIDTAAPERFTMIPYRPVLEVRPVVEAGVLLFVGHHSILAWGAGGQAWESDKLSDEGVTVTAMEDGRLCGLGWEMVSDKETPFTLDLKTGRLAG